MGTRSAPPPGPRAPRGRCACSCWRAPPIPPQPWWTSRWSARSPRRLRAIGAERPLISVDNTFLGPLLQRPASHGADLTITSLTKYCGGHSDLLGGSVSGSAELVGRLKALRTIVGNHMEPFTAWLMLRSLESLAVRQERACANAAVVAAFLREHPKVEGRDLPRLPGARHAGARGL